MLCDVAQNNVLQREDIISLLVSCGVEIPDDMDELSGECVSFDHVREERVGYSCCSDGVAQ